MQRFTEEEAQEILRRAAREPVLGEYTRDDLQQSAAELGISNEALARAEAEVREERTRVEFERVLANQLRNEAVRFALLMVMLIAINLLTSPFHLWFFYPMIGFGISVAMLAYRVKNRSGESYRKAFAQWQESDGKASGDMLTKTLRR